MEKEVSQMKYPTRIYYTEADKSLMWARWQDGAVDDFTLSEISPGTWRFEGTMNWPHAENSIQR
jgi:hypothetical protein